MPRKNLLSLHEAIAVALITMPGWTGTFEEIEKIIIKRHLTPIRNGNIPLSRQIMLRSRLSKGRYHYLFEAAGISAIRLRMA